MARRAAVRMSSRQQYRTMSRMQRRRSGGQDQQQEAEPGPAAPAVPDYTDELAKLAQLRDQGVITPEDFEAKKRQVLGI